MTSTGDSTALLTSLDDVITRLRHITNEFKVPDDVARRFDGLAGVKTACTKCQMFKSAVRGPSLRACLTDCSLFDPREPYLWIFLVCLFICLSFDIFFLLRAMFDALYTKLSRSATAPHLLAEHIYAGRCLLSDLDFTMSMTDTRFLRECALARYVFFSKTHLLDTARMLNGTVVNNGNNIRYRKPLTLFQTFRIHSRILCWDKISFYVEQKVIRTLDEFVVAINYTRQTVIGTTPQEMIDSLHGHLTSPPPPPEISSWIENAKISSRSLKLAGYR